MSHWKYRLKLHTCQLSWFSRESPSFSSILPASQLEHQITRELFTMAFLKLFFIYFIILDISKRKIKQGDLLLLFELSSIGKHKQSNQIDVYLTSLLIGQKPTNQIAQYLMENWHDFRMLFTSVKAKMASMDFGSLQKEFLGTLPLGFERVERLDLQKERNFKESFSIFNSCVIYHMYRIFHCFHIFDGALQKKWRIWEKKTSSILIMFLAHDFHCCKVCLINTLQEVPWNTDQFWIQHNYFNACLLRSRGKVYLWLCYNDMKSLVVKNPSLQWKF